MTGELAGPAHVSVSDDEFVEQIASLTARLDDHLERVDAGLTHARDDLAVVLRILIGPDNVLGRFVRRFREMEPGSWVTPLFLPVDEGIVTFSVGHFPSSSPNKYEVHAAVPSGLRRKTCLQVLLLDHGDKRLTWCDFVALYANKFGAHIDATIPYLLDKIRVHGVSGTDLGTYMLRAVGVEVSRAAHLLLSRRRSHHAPRTHDRFFQGVHVMGAYVVMRPEGNGTFRPRVEAPFTVREELWREGIPIISLRLPDGNLVRVETGPGAYGENAWIISDEGSHLITIGPMQ